MKPWDLAAAALGGETRRVETDDGGTFQTLIAESARVDAGVVSSEGPGGWTVHLRFLGGQDARTLHQRLDEDPDWDAAVQAATGAGWTTHRVQLGDGQARLLFGQLPCDPRALPRLLARADAIFGTEGTVERTCDQCAGADAPLTLDGMELVRVCPACAERRTLLTARWEAMSPRVEPPEADPVHPDLPLPPGLDHETLQERAAELAVQYQQHPAAYRARLWAWVLGGQAVLALGATALLLGGLGLAMTFVFGLAIAAKSLGGASLIVLKAILSLKVLKLLFFPLIAGATMFRRMAGSASAFLRGMPPRELGGEVVLREDAPQLYAWLDALAERVGSPRVDEVRVFPTFTAFAAEHRAGLYTHRRVVGLGIALLEVLDVEAFTAIMAHELGHLSAQHTRTVRVYRAAHDWVDAAFTLSDDVDAPVARLARWYLPRFLLRAKVVCREHERHADDCSAAVVDPETCGRALLSVGVLSRTWSEAVDRGVRLRAVHTEDEGPVSPAALYRAGLETGLLERARREDLEEPQHWTDSHPSTTERLARFGVSSDLDLHLDQEPRATASELFESFAAMRRRMLGDLDGRMAILVALHRTRAHAARVRLERSERAEPTAAWHLRRARDYRELEDRDAALAEIERAIALDPAHADALGQRVDLLSALGRDDQAALAGAELARQRDNASSWLGLARLAARAHRLDLEREGVEGALRQLDEEAAPHLYAHLRERLAELEGEPAGS